MRLFIYEECEGMINALAKDCNLPPTKYLNTLLKVLNDERDDCQDKLTEEVHEKIKRIMII